MFLDATDRETFLHESAAGAACNGTRQVRDAEQNHAFLLFPVDLD